MEEQEAMAASEAANHATVSVSAAASEATGAAAASAASTPAAATSSAGASKAKVTVKRQTPSPATLLVQGGGDAVVPAKKQLVMVTTSAPGWHFLASNQTLMNEN